MKSSSIDKSVNARQDDTPSCRAIVSPTPQSAPPQTRPLRTCHQSSLLTNADSFQDREPNLVAALFPQATGSHDEDQLDDGLLSVSPLKQRHLMWSCLLTGPTGLIRTSTLIDSGAQWCAHGSNQSVGGQTPRPTAHQTTDPFYAAHKADLLTPSPPTSSSATPCAPNRRSFACTEMAAHERYRRAYSTTKPSRPACA